jgi:PAP2 superfamily
MVVYQGYQVVRGFADGKAALAFANGERVIDLERSIGTFFEAGFQRALLDHQWLIDLANWSYFNTHFVITVGFLAWLYLLRNEHFYFVRNMFMVAMVLALVGYAAFPTAPPRMFPEEGFTDTVAMFTGIEQDENTKASFLVNAYAAVPSMHIGFSLLVAVPAMALSSSAIARALWSVYPLFVFFVIVATANHYWFDAAAGAAVACLAAVTAHQLARIRPERWSWREAPSEAVA